jgi:hypothetical protein
MPESKKARKNRRIAKVYENTASSTGNKFLSVSVSKPYSKEGKVFGGRVLFEDAETGKLYEIKAASIFQTKEGEQALYDIVIDLENDYQITELG